MSPRVRSVLPYAFFFLTPLLVFPPAMLGAGMMDGQDDKLSNLPLLLYSGRKLLAGEIFWSPDLWMGTPLLAEPEAATFYLPRLMLLVLPPAVGYALYVLLHFVAAQATAYLYLRQLELRRGPATFGAVGYAFTGFMLGHAGHTMYVVAGAWAPLFLYFAHRAMIGEGRISRSLLGAAVAFAACFFGGAVQLSVYLLSLAGLLHLALSVFTRSWRPLATFAAVGASGLLLSAPQLLVSLDNVHGLADATRRSYEFATDLSFPPLLFSTLVLPTRPLEYAELYSRVGLTVVVAAAVGALGSRGRSPIVRAWVVVAMSALVLMLGRFVPPVAKTLHAIPGLYVLRGPARHNFELGMAFAVLAAFGAQELADATARRPRAAPIAAVAAAGTSIVGLLVVRAGWIHVAHGSMLTEIPDVSIPTVVAMTVVAAGAWLVLWRHVGGRYARFLPVALVALALGETRTAEGLDADFFWEPVARPGVPRDPPAPQGSFTRIIPADIRQGGYPTLPGNAVLYFPGVESLLGYASIAPSDAVTTFDLDMHGHARHLEDLLWSRLPEVYGVTHVVMPEAVCGGLPSAGIAPAAAIDAPCATGHDAFRLQAEERRCTIDARAQRLQYRIDAELKYRVSDELRSRRPRGPVELGVWSPQGRPGTAKISIDPEQIRESSFVAVGGTLDLAGLADGEGWLGAYTDDVIPVEVRNLRLSALRLSPREVVSGEPLVISRGNPIEKRFTFPADAGSFRLEIVARRVEGTPRLVLDLYDGAGFDPESAQLVVEDELSDQARLFAKEFALPVHPPSTQVRVFVEGDGSAEVIAARWLVEEPTVIARMESGLEVHRKACELRGDDLVLSGSDSGAILHVSLPVRPVVITADLAPGGSENDGTVGVGVAGRTTSFSDANETVFPAGALTKSLHVERAVALPADAPAVFLRAYSLGARPVEVRSLAMDDACALGRYIPERPIEQGLWLYRTENPMPRAFVVGAVSPVASIEEARDLLRGSPAFDPRSTALVQLDGATPPSGLRPGALESVQFSGQGVDLAVTSPDGPTFVVINDHYDPRFVAAVDGVATHVFRTNAMVRGLFVPAGRHQVSLRYQPPRVFYLGLGCALLALLLAVVAFPRTLARITALARKQVGLG